MTKEQYAQYLGNLIDFEIDIDNTDISDQFYSFFQSFMPEGKGVEKVFEPLTKGKELYNRIIPIYEVTEEHTKQLINEDLFPGYFCPQPSAEINELINIGKLHIERLKDFSTFIDDGELTGLLNNIKEVVVQESFPEQENNEINDYLYDAISDWSIENKDNNELISVLDEAYYSINCDYYLSYYLQYPVIKNKPETDFLEPYFKIWSSGYYCKFNANQLVIYK